VIPTGLASGLGVPIALSAIALLLIVLLQRTRADVKRLRRRLEGAARELEELQASFGRFAPAPIIERVIAHGVESRGEKKDVTVLFADLVGFTAIAESIEPPVLVQVLNGYFERMSRAIVSNRGHVSTFIGDGILALFGALEPNPWQANDAAHAALAMQRELADYGVELAAAGLPVLRIGIGLHRGTGVAALVGSRELVQFAFVGRVVNVAARVQTLTRDLAAPLLVTDAVRDSLDPSFRTRELPPTRVKGVERPLVIFALEGYEGGAATHAG
jgi:class 3 adenylate cyclase